MPSLRTTAIGFIASIALCMQAFAQEPGPAKVVVLSTLHQIHHRVSGYSYQRLIRILEQLKPDIIAAELTDDDIASLRDQSVKTEYQLAVFPYIRRTGVPLVAIEPTEPRYSELVGLMRNATKSAKTVRPERYKTLTGFTNTLYDHLYARWTDACSVQSETTDALFEVKHRFQNDVLGKDEKQGWEGWNQEMASRIASAARRNPGKRIVVLVGAEHGYWIRQSLSRQAGVQVEERCPFQ